MIMHVSARPYGVSASEQTNAYRGKPIEGSRYSGIRQAQGFGCRSEERSLGQAQTASSESLGFAGLGPALWLNAFSYVTQRVKPRENLSKTERIMCLNGLSERKGKPKECEAQGIQKPLVDFVQGTHRGDP